MTKPLYPIYTQDEAIASLLNELSEINTDSEKRIQTSKESTKKNVGASVKLSLFEVFEGDTNLGREGESGTDYTEESVFSLGVEHKAKRIRNILRERGVLYDLNQSLIKHRPFGSFVDFRGLASFGRIEDIIKVSGVVEDFNFVTFCSCDMFTSRSFLFHLLRSEKKIGVVGFGIVTDVIQDKKTLEIKSLLLAFDTKAFNPFIY